MRDLMILSTCNYKDFLFLAYQEASKSIDPSTQNGALIVNEETQEIISSGHNRFPKDVQCFDDRWERPLKYKYIEHAERNSIYDAVKNGVSTNGLTMFCPWAACADCARGIIEAGIKKLVTHKQAHDRSSTHWKDEIDIAFTMFSEANIEIFMYDGHICEENPIELRHSGEIWIP